MAEPVQETEEVPEVVLFAFTFNTKTSQGTVQGNVSPMVALSILQSLVVNLLSRQIGGNPDETPGAPEEPQT